MKNVKIAFIGGGNMATSIIGGLINDGFNPENIWVSNPGEEKRQYLRATFMVNTTANNHEAVSCADVVILAVKPQILKSVAIDLAPSTQAKKPLVISIAAGILSKDLDSWLSGAAVIVRALPNTPSLLGCGATALFAMPAVSDAQKELAENIFRSVGSTTWVETENLLDSAMAIAGCGPAYLFLVMEAMQKAGVNMGLSPEDSKILTLQSALGAARMALESKEDVVELRQRVTSKGGVTEQAINVLQEGGLEDLVERAMRAVVKRSEEIADEFGR